MFLPIQTELVNINHIVNFTIGKDLTFVNLSNGKRISIATIAFEESVLPFLPLAKKLRKKGDE